MNFHSKSGLDPAESESRLAYRVASKDAAPSISATRRVAALAGAPILGSRRLFPRRFDRAARVLLEDPEAAEVSPEQAAWYYGASVRLEIDPASLVYRISDYVVGAHGAKWMGTSFLDAADWSAVLSPIDQSPIHRETLELVAAGADYRDTQAYRILAYGIEIGRPSLRNGMRITTTQEIEAYLHYCRDLIKSARKRGIVRHRASGGFHRLRLKHRDARSPVHDTSERDIGVAIAADGQLIRHLGGKHRTAIAQALKLPRLPVEVRLVHMRWLAEQMQRTGLPPHAAMREGLDALRAAVDVSG